MSRQGPCRPRNDMRLVVTMVKCHTSSVTAGLKHHLSHELAVRVGTSVMMLFSKNISARLRHYFTLARGPAVVSCMPLCIVSGSSTFCSLTNFTDRPYCGRFDYPVYHARGPSRTALFSIPQKLSKTTASRPLSQRTSTPPSLT